MDLSIENLVRAGIHFGHKTSKWNPKMAQYIYGKNNGIHIIDIRRTIEGLLKAQALTERIVANGGEVLFVGTKRQARNPVETVARSNEMHFSTERWIGGTLTNFDTVMTRLNRLFELEQFDADGTMTLYSKKERSQLYRELNKLRRNLDGIRSMKRLPALLVVVDPKREKNAIREANRMGIPIIALLDTDSDPSSITVPIPGNDDSIKVIQIVLQHISGAIVNSKGKRIISFDGERKSSPETTRSQEILSSSKQ